MIKVSVCMIVKNEEAVLARCLDSLSGLYEELVIVDTGSTDATKEIAAKYTYHIYDYAWCDDFSDARNYAFSLCTQDYIYSVDADEVLDEINRERFRWLKENILPEIEIVQMWYVNSGSFATTENFAKEYRPKLYKRLRSFQWIDPVHESVRLDPVVYDSEIEILHLPQGSHGKRDFGVFEKAVRRGETLSPKLHGMYARELWIAGETEDLERAAGYFGTAVWDAQRSEEDRRLCYVILSRLNRRQGDRDEFFKWSLKDICTSPSAEVCDELGMYYYDAGDYPEAMVWFQNAMTETQAFLSPKATDEIPKEMMACCYERMAELDETMREYYLEMAEDYRKQNS